MTMRAAPSTRKGPAEARHGAASALNLLPLSGHRGHEGTCYRLCPVAIDPCATSTPPPLPTWLLGAEKTYFVGFLEKHGGLPPAAASPASVVTRDGGPSDRRPDNS